MRSMRTSAGRLKWRQAAKLAECGGEKGVAHSLPEESAQGGGARGCPGDGGAGAAASSGTAAPLGREQGRSDSVVAALRTAERTGGWPRCCSTWTPWRRPLWPPTSFGARSSASAPKSRSSAYGERRGLRRLLRLGAGEPHSSPQEHRHRVYRCDPCRPVASSLLGKLEVNPVASEARPLQPPRPAPSAHARRARRLNDQLQVFYDGFKDRVASGRSATGGPRIAGRGPGLDRRRGPRKGSRGRERRLPYRPRKGEASPGSPKTRWCSKFAPPRRSSGTRRRPGGR